MKKIIILIYDNFPEQTPFFIKSFREVNKSDYYEYEFVRVQTEGTDIDGIEKLDKIDGDYRFSFLQKIDEIISKKPDLIIVADCRTFCVRNMVIVFDTLLDTPDTWELCGDYVSPSFPLIFSSGYETTKYFVFTNFGFAILNPKTMQSNNAEIAKSIVPSDMTLYIDRYALNLIYTRKIIECGLCIDRNAHCSLLSHGNNCIYNVIMDINKTDTPTEQNNTDFAMYFLHKYLDYVDGELRHTILRNLPNIPDLQYLSYMHTNYIIDKLARLNNTPNEFVSVQSESE